MRATLSLTSAGGGDASAAAATGEADAVAVACALGAACAGGACVADGCEVTTVSVCSCVPVQAESSAVMTRIIRAMMCGLCGRRVLACESCILLISGWGLV